MKLVGNLVLILIVSVELCSADYWTEWTDRDNGGGTGDWERIKDHPGDWRPCGGRETIMIHARVVGVPNTGIKTRDNLYVGPKYGLLCSNGAISGKCRDYAVRYYSFPSNPTWYDVGNPGFKDKEFKWLHPGAPNVAWYMKFRDQSLIWNQYRVDQQLRLSPRYGLECRNIGQICKDYEVRYRCGDYPKLGFKSNG